MQMQIQSFISANVDLNTEFMELWYKYAKIRSEVNKLKDEQQKTAERRAGTMSRG